MTNTESTTQPITYRTATAFAARSLGDAADAAGNARWRAEAARREGLTDSATAWSSVEMALADVATARAAIEEATTELVRAARAGGIAWAAIGDALGVTKQAAQQRYGKTS